MHPYFPFLIWLMIAQSRPGFHPCGSHLGMCLRILWEVAAIPWKDPLKLSLENPNEAQKLLDQIDSEYFLNNLGNVEKMLVKSILIRGAYGGRVLFHG